MVSFIEIVIHHNLTASCITQKSISSQQSLSTHNTPLHLATKLCNDARIVELLLMNNANPNALDNVSQLPKFALSTYYMHIFTKLVQANTFTLGSNER